MRAFVTGGTGFIGANVVRALLERGFQVRALVRPSSQLSNLEGLDVELVQGDVRDPRSIKRGMAGCQAVFHIAALYSFWVRPRQLIYQVNVDGTRNVLQVAEELGVERVVYTSSVAALGLGTREQPADETTPVQPTHIIGDYKKSKYLAQQVALEFARRGLPVVIVNPSYPVGPYDIKPTPSGKLIQDFLARRVPAYVDTGMNVVAVEDVAQGHLLALERGRQGECYILGGENITMKEFLQILAELTGLPAPKWRLPFWPLLGLSYLNVAWCRVSGGTPRMTPDTLRMSRHYMYYRSSKAERELGYTFRPAREALATAVEWFESRRSEPN